MSIDVPWYDPYDDFASISIAFPTPIKDPSLPNHLDRYLAAVPAEDGLGRTVLEIGCGERQCEPWFSRRGYQYVGMDVDHRGPGPTILADAHQLPFADGTFDYCTSMAVLEHVLSPILVASEVCRVLKPGGVFFGSSAFVYGFHDRASYYHMSHGGLIHALGIAGLQIKQIWPDWPYTSSIPAWSFRGMNALPWRLASNLGLRAAESSFVAASSLVRRMLGKTPINRIGRMLESAGSISFIATRPPVTE
ncbi:MAG: class I SAM-dependent methyltransferase [Pseudomonadales bacterium]